MLSAPLLAVNFVKRIASRALLIPAADEHLIHQISSLALRPLIMKAQPTVIHQLLREFGEDPEVRLPD